MMDPTCNAPREASNRGERRTLAETATAPRASASTGPAPNGAVRRRLRWIGVGAFLACGALGVVVAVATHLRAVRPDANNESRPRPPSGASRPANPPGTVEMPGHQQRAVGVRVARAESGTAFVEAKAPGRIAADQEHFAFITPRAPGVVRSVAVNIGQEVRAGDVLATIDSSEVGRARLELRTQAQLLEVAKAQATWQAEVHANTVELIDALRRGDEPDAIQERLEGRPVGTGRDRLMTAYAQVRVASAAVERDEELVRSDAVSVSQFQRVRAAYEAASGSYQALLDSTGYEARMADLRAQQAVRQAETAVGVARERLRILGVGDVDPGPAGPAPSRDVPLSTYTLVAPFDGTVLDRDLVVPGISVDVASRLFTIADLSTVWVEANVSEGDSGLLARAAGGEVRFASPAFPGRSFSGRVLYRGDLVDEASRSVKLLAAVPNGERLLKPGMFVEVTLRFEPGGDAAHVPDSALVAAGDGSFVFVRSGPERFERREVVLGGSSGGRAAVVRGLEPGEEVVVEGASKLEAKADAAAGGGRLMFDRLVTASMRNRPMVLLGMAALAASGAYSLSRLPIDAVPDITPVQVMALTDSPALGPQEVEQFITVPVENAMNGIPRIREVRSISQFGLSVVSVVFEEGTDIYWARQLVGERLDEVERVIPREFGEPEMGPIATGLGEIYQFEVRNAAGSARKRSLMELREILDWEVARPLKGVPGVIEVNAFGGELKTYEVRLDPEKLAARGIPASRVFEAIRRNNGNSGGGYIQRNGTLRVVRAEGLIGDVRALGDVVLATTPAGTPVTVADVGEVLNAPMIRQGAVTRDGRGEAVTATVLLLAGENSRAVVGRVKAKLAEIRGRLPEGVEVDAYYDRSTLIDRAIGTVARNLAEGGILVVVVLLALLGNLRAGLIVALAIPLSMLFAGELMLGFGIAGSLMSLGALDFGLIVDSAVIVIENCVSRLAHAPPGRSAVEVVREATLEVRRPVVYGVAIITLVHLPLLALEGVEGKMFRPMAATVIFALTGSLLLSLTATPVLASFALRPGASERETWPVRVAKRLYRPVLRVSLARPVAVVAAAVAAFAACLPIAARLGAEFIPKLDEGDMLLVVTRPPRASLDEGLRDSSRLEAALLAAFPDEIRSVVCRTGRPEIGLDPAGVNRTDVFLFLEEPSAWTRAHSRDELIAGIERVGAELLPGASLSFSQPIETRFNEMLSGVQADLGLALSGNDLRLLQEKARAIAGVLRSVPGAVDVKEQRIDGLPYLRIVVDRDRIARLGIDAADVLDVVSALGGKEVGQVVVDQRRFSLQVRFAPRYRDDVEAIRALRVADPHGRMIPLEDLAEIRIEDGVYEIWRKDRERRAMIQANVRGRDLAGFVAEARARVEAEVGLPRGYRLEWGGTFENLQSATRRLALVVPAAMALIFLLLYVSFGSLRLGLLIFLSVPLGAIGGVLALWLRGLSFSISAGVGFIALSGVSVLDGLVLVSAIRQRIAGGAAVGQAVGLASMDRLRPILMTGLVASLGFVPMAVSHGAGAEVQRPLATVVIGGLVTSMLLKLVVIPAAYRWFDPGSPAPGSSVGVPTDGPTRVSADGTGGVGAGKLGPGKDDTREFGGSAPGACHATATGANHDEPDGTGFR